jgi:diguanylate cyclase (GGDEF)-like protein
MRSPGERRPADPGTASMPREMGFGRLGEALIRAGRGAWERAFGRGAARFEDVLHGYAAELGMARYPEGIEAALLRLAGQVAPSDRAELIRATGELAGREGAQEAREQAETSRCGGPDALTPEESVQEFPLRCGLANHGALRLHGPASKDPGGMRPQTRRRLALACTLAACALENMRGRAEWSWEGEDEAGGARIGGVEDISDPAERRPSKQPDVVRDATFLNAVLPFALGQSRRHGEPVSLLCVQLDRLGAIRDLLGDALADRLVHELGHTVAALVRASDIVARLDDDRIVALLVRSRGEGALKVARMIAHAVADSGLGSPRLPGASAAIGVAEFPATAADAASLLQAADEAMAMARAAGSHSPVLAGARSAPAHVPAPAMAMPPAMASCGA